MSKPRENPTVFLENYVKHQNQVTKRCEILKALYFQTYI